MTVSYSETLVSSPIGAQGAYPKLTKGHEGLIGDLQAYVSRSSPARPALLSPSVTLDP